MKKQTIIKMMESSFTLPIIFVVIASFFATYRYSKGGFDYDYIVTLPNGRYSKEYYVKGNINRNKDGCIDFEVNNETIIVCGNYSITKK